MQLHLYGIIVVVLQPLIIPTGAEDYECLDNESLLNTTLTVGVPVGQTKYNTFHVPPLPTDFNDYSYAFEHAFIVLPLRCADALGLSPNMADSNGIINQWMGRMEDLREAPAANTQESRDNILSKCACGWVIFLHGSSGFTYDNPRYAINMAAAGYGVIAPDSFASPSPTTRLRYRKPIKGLASHLKDLNSNAYWCSDNVYEKDSDCTPAVMNNQSGYPLCYSSDVQLILSHPRQWQQFYERVYQLRKLELDYMIDKLPIYFKNASKVFLAGESEGGMVAARYYNSKLEPLLESGGRVILQWSCEWCYYVSCRANARVGSGQANQSTPILNLISNVDPFFGPTKDSIAWGVAHGQDGYGNDKATGNCFSQLQAQGFDHAYVVQFEQSPYHGLTETTGNLVRTIFFSFLADPRNPYILSTLGTQKSDLHLCDNLRWNGGIMYASCNELGEEDNVLGGNLTQCAYPGYHYHKQYHLLGGYEECAVFPYTGITSLQPTENSCCSGHMMVFVIAAFLVGSFFSAACVCCILYARHKSFKKESTADRETTEPLKP